MKTLSEINRNRTFEEIRDIIPLERKKVLEVIKDHPYSTLLSISNILNKGKNAISGRITELKEQCLIKQVEITQVAGEKRKYTSYIAITNEDERIDLINQKFKEYREEVDQLTNSINTFKDDLDAISLESLKSELKKAKEKLRKLDEIS